MNKEQKEFAEGLVKKMIELIGEDPERPGLVGTPERVVRMWKEIFRGYDPKQLPKVTIFDNGTDGVTYNQMITDEGDYYSHCEHHIVPFMGKYFFAYIPNPKGKLLGLSKVARIVGYFSAKLQIQERLCQEIVDELWDVLDTDLDYPPLGMAIHMKGEHLCKSMRGVKMKGLMSTTYLKGEFEKPDVKAEFFNNIKF